MWCKAGIGYQPSICPSTEVKPRENLTELAGHRNFWMHTLLVLASWLTLNNLKATLSIQY